MAVVFTRSETPGTEEATLFYGNDRDADSVSIKDDGIRSTEQRSRALFPWESRSLVRRRILQLVVAVLGIVIIVLIIVAVKLSSLDTEYSYLATARFNPKEKGIDFRNAAGLFVLSAEIGLKLTATLEERHSKSKSRAKYATRDGLTLTLTQETDHLFSVNWTGSPKKPAFFMDCFILSNAHWYGGSELLWQKWPLEKVQVDMGQYVPQSISIHGLKNKSEQSFGPVLERYWLTSSGIAVIVDASVPLHVSINASGDGKLCLKSDMTGYIKPAVNYLGYRILSGYNPRDLHLTVIDKFLGKPSTIPDETLIKKPLWIIGNDFDNTSQNSIGSLSDEISSFNYSCGYVVVGRQKGWSSMSEVLSMKVNQLKQIGCKISMNIHPYLQIGTRGFLVAEKKGYLLKDCGGDLPGLIRWNDQISACIDFTLASSKAWFKNTLQSLGFDSFEFHGGDVSHLPSCYQFYNKSMDPGFFSSEYARFAASMNGLNVHVGYQTQSLPIFVRMASKEPTWNGLKTIIPTVLTYGIMGYPYVLPSIASNNHGSMDEELYIRWMQMVTFLPGLQFQIEKAPWKFNLDNITTARKLLLQLRSHLSSIMMDAFKNVTLTGSPIIRPLWWVAPKDQIALSLDSEFMLGDKILVSPIMESGQTEKNVYLPPGKWQEQFEGKNEIHDIKKTGKWFKYRVYLKSVLYFKCLAMYN